MPDDTLTIRPQPARRIAGSTACVAWYAPSRFERSTGSHSSTASASKSGIVHGVRLPHCTALLTNTSIRSQRSSAAVATAWIDSASASAIGRASASPPLASISATTPSARSRSRW